VSSSRDASVTTLAVGDTHTPDELDADAHAPDLSHVRFDAGPEGITVTTV
jgi:mannitol-1-/sugar-/sorbitol-6-phosphatase